MGGSISKPQKIKNKKQRNKETKKNEINHKKQIFKIQYKSNIFFIVCILYEVKVCATKLKSVRKIETAPQNTYNRKHLRTSIYQFRQKV